MDGFLGAYWRRLHVYLDPMARRSMSSFARIDAEDGLGRLASDLNSGGWRKRNAIFSTSKRWMSVIDCCSGNSTPPPANVRFVPGASRRHSSGS
jgi:hypothetical protein